MADKFLEELRAQPFYQGQIHRIETVDATAVVTTSCQEFLDNLKKFQVQSDCLIYDVSTLENILQAAGITEISLYQQEALKRLLKRTSGVPSDIDTLILTSPGSGRTTLGCVVACYRVLAFAENTMVIAANAVAGREVHQKIKTIIREMGFDYAIEIDYLGDTPSSASEGLPEILVATPVQLARLFEENSKERLSPVFFSCLSLILMEDIHEYIGIYGSNVAALMRCVRLLLERHNNTPVFLCTAMPFDNIEAFAQELIGRQIPKQGGVLMQGKGGETRKTVVFWDAPLSLYEADSSSIKRQGLKEDLESLLTFLAPYGLAEPVRAPRRFCFLLDASAIPKCPVEYKKVLESLIRDMEVGTQPVRLRKGDIIEYYFYSQRLSSIASYVVTDSGIFHSENSGEAFDVKDLQTKLMAAPREQSGSALASLIEYLGIVLNCSGGEESLSRIAVFIYSASEENITETAFVEARKRVQALTVQKHIPVDMFHIALGLSADPKLGLFVKSIGGQSLGLDQKERLEPPSKIWKTDTFDNRPVVVFCQDDSLTTSDIVNFEGARGRVFLYPSYGFPGIEGPSFVPNYDYVATTEKMLRCQHMIVAGWNGSPSYLRQMLRHVGKNDAYIFIVGMPNPLNQLMQKEWEILSEETPPDCLATNYYSFEAGVRAVEYFCRYDALSFEESARIVYGGQPDGKNDRAEELKRRLHSSPCVHLIGDNLVSPKDAVPLFWKYFHVAHKPMKLSAGNWFLDETILLREVAVNNTLIINGNSQNITTITDTGIEITPSNRRNMVSPIFSLNITETDGDAPMRQISELSGAHMKPVRIHVRAVINGIRTFSNKDCVSYEEVSVTDRACEFDTQAIKITFGQDVSVAVLTALENIFFIYANALIRGERKGCLAYSLPEQKTLYIVDVVSDGSGIAALFVNYPRLLNMILRLSTHGAIHCACGDAPFSEETDTCVTLPYVPDDSGCAFCLYAPAKPTGLQADSMRKKEYLEFICNSNHEWKQFYDAWTNHQYIQSADPLRLILRTLEDSLGIIFPNEQQAAIRFGNDAEFGGGCIGFYCSGSREIVIKRELGKHLMMLTIAHEIAHHWQHQQCFKGRELWGTYDVEYVLGHDNIPFLGRLFLEGSAEWLALHIMEYLAPRSQITMCEESGGNEYSVGLSFMKEFEKKYGLQSVLTFLKEACFPEGINSLSDLYRELSLQQIVAARCVNKEYYNVLTPLERQGEVMCLSALAASYNRGERITDSSYDDTDDVRELKEHLTQATISSLLEQFREPLKAFFVANDLPGCLSANAITLKRACHVHSSTGRSTTDLLNAVLDFLVRSGHPEEKQG